jgi:hypothetical protein
MVGILRRNMLPIQPVAETPGQLQARGDKLLRRHPPGELSSSASPSPSLPSSSDELAYISSTWRRSLGGMCSRKRRMSMRALSCGRQTGAPPQTGQYAASGTVPGVASPQHNASTDNESACSRCGGCLIPLAAA